MQTSAELIAGAASSVVSTQSPLIIAPVKQALDLLLTSIPVKMMMNVQESTDLVQVWN